MPSFVDHLECRELLTISKQHLDAVDRNRVRPDGIIGIDNLNTLKVSTVFAAMSIEVAVNDYILIHCLFVDTPYLQDVFGEITTRYLRVPVSEKIDFLKHHWPDEFPEELLLDVRKLFAIRNRIAHQSSKFLPLRKGKAVMKNRPLTNEEMRHMLRHYDLAHDFLSRFWLPGDRELRQSARSGESGDAE